MLPRLWPTRSLLRTVRRGSTSLTRTAPVCISQPTPGFRSRDRQPGAESRTASSTTAAGRLISSASSAAIFSAQSSPCRRSPRTTAGLNNHLVPRSSTSHVPGSCPPGSTLSTSQDETSTIGYARPTLFAGSIAPHVSSRRAPVDADHAFRMEPSARYPGMRRRSEPATSGTAGS